MSARHKDALPYSSPEAQGISSSTILDFIQTLESQIDEIHSFVLLRHGHIVAEGWWTPYAPHHRHMLFSLSKSFTSTAVGIAINEGYFSLDDPVISFFPDESPAESDALLRAMTVHHLLSMSTGHADDTLFAMSTRRDMNWIKGFLDVPVIYKPGTHFVYNTGATYMLSAIVQKTTRQKLSEYLTPRLFEPLDIESVTWDTSPQGIELGGIGMYARTVDVAKFGQLYLQKGVWQGQQILQEAWVSEATRTQISNSETSLGDWSQGYGYQFWRCRHDAYRGDGVFGQFCIVMPEQDAVLAITSGTDSVQEVLDIVWERLLPHMHVCELAQDVTSAGALTHKLTNLAHAPVPGQATSPLAARVSGQTYIVDANDLHIESVCLTFAGADCVISVKTTSDEQTITSGYGQWAQGHTSLFDHSWLEGSVPVLTSGAWVTEDCFSIIARLYQTPFFNTLDFHFADDQLMIEVRVNVSLESMAPHIITGRSSALSS